MKKIFSLTLIIALVFSFVGAVSAASSSAASAAAIIGASAAASAAANAERQQVETASRSGCIPPVDFAERHDCKLEYTRYVNEYDCGYYHLKTDCEGNIKNSTSSEGDINFILIVIFGSIMVGLIIMLIVWIIDLLINNKPEPKNYY